MPRLGLTAAPLNLAIEGIHDNFSRPDGVVGNGWYDAHDLYPTQFDQAVILDGYLDTTGSTVSTFAAPGDPPADPETALVVGHTLIAQECPWSDDFQVTVKYSTADPLAYLSQISPCIYVDLDADYLEMGIKPVADVGLEYATYWQNVFRSAALDDVFDPAAYYRTLQDPSLDGMAGRGDNLPLGGVGPGTTQELTIRVRDGYCRFFWNGSARNTVDMVVPAYCLDGRPNWVGIDVISIHGQVGVTYANYGTPDHIVRDQIISFTCQQYTGPLS